jgi:hypothetical protein
MSDETGFSACYPPPSRGPVLFFLAKAASALLLALFTGVRVTPTFYELG